ncbi:MAG: Hsp20/alpha crystallin family protein [Candidatus Magasanikbacteria bacterium]
MPFSPPINSSLDELEIVELGSASALEVHEQIEEGQLAIDVAQTATELIVVATMAGTNPADVSLHVHGDLLTIHGVRRPPIKNDGEYFYQECYWGKFSRTVVLPVEVEGEMAKAEYKYGILTIRLPKVHKESEIPIEVVDE